MQTFFIGVSNWELLNLMNYARLALSLAFETRIFLPKNAPIHPIQPNLKELTRQISYNNLSFYFGFPILMFFSSSIAKLAIILDNLYWNLISALNYLPKIEKSCFEIRNVNKPLKYWCRKTFVMFQIFWNRGRIINP